MKSENNRKNKKIYTSLFMVTILLVGAILLVTLTWTTPAQAHCDSYHGPVVQAASTALDTGDVNLVLPYIQPEDEAELKAAFRQASDVRKLSSEARELADEYFYEVVVRLHRQGEGAPYTGLKDEKVPESIAAADHAMQSGDLNGVYELLQESLEKGLHEKFDAVLEAREHAEKEGTVEAHRQRVQAELMFEKYVYELHNLALAEDLHEGGGHSH